MSDFFARPPQPEEPPAERHLPPPWSEPPRGVLPGVVGVEMVLARNARAAVFVTRVDIDAQPVIDAAARAQLVFPDQPARDNEVSWSSSTFTYGKNPLDRRRT